MLEIFKKSDFKIMPWKNGGGITTEIFKIPSKKSESFLFRLSLANISMDGPFSAFLNIDRILVLINGSGLHLKGDDRNIELNKLLTPLHFRGEEIFFCSLLNGPCVDFNIMTDRNYANSTFSLIHPENNAVMNFQANCDLKFIYDIGNEILYKLERSDFCNLSATKDFPLIVIDTTFL